MLAIEKLALIGLNGTLVRFFGEFLKDRTQRVIVRSEFSSFARVTSGVPQGTVLGPVLSLSLLYINDILR